MRTWLRELREEKGLTQESLAIKADIERTTYSSIEQGRRNPSVRNAMRIASSLDFDWVIFFDEELREMTREGSDKTHKQPT
ncbi:MULTISPECIES: helix-turn-helix transcriptional regulator [Listeria]|uniref:helix-turn-helix transcriptional regulator n=1 Tax=Listeria TaxID=1637 RepID=UPI000B5961CA|nr:MULTISPECIES: helix-turn-helix transcriptional regulator [Listeria]